MRPIADEFHFFFRQFAPDFIDIPFYFVFKAYINVISVTFPFGITSLVQPMLWQIFVLEDRISRILNCFPFLTLIFHRSNLGVFVTCGRR